MSADPSVAHQLDEAARLHRAGRLAEAAALYDALIAASPGNAELLRRHAEALAQQGRLAEAARRMGEAVAAAPGSAEGHFELGNLLAAAGRMDEAITSYRNALAANPDYQDALFNLGNAYHARGRNEEALTSFERVLALDPALHLAWFNRGNVLRALGDYEAAIESYGRALGLRADFPEAHNNRGSALAALGRHGEAIESFGAALRTRPDYAEAHNNMGVALDKLERHREAVQCYLRALEAQPDYAEAHRNLGATYAELRRFEDAAASYARALAIDPERDYLRGLLFANRMRVCDWASYDREARLITTEVRAGHRTIDPFPFMWISETAEDQFTCTATWVGDNCPPAAESVWRGEKYRHDRIRVAYLSADFHNHPLAHLMSGLIERHDRARFEVTAVSFGPADRSRERGRLKRAFDRFVDARLMGDRDVAALLREMEIDIAVDRKGFTKDCRPGIFALRPAPVQVNYLAYPGTMGAPYIDYIIADRTVIPEDQRQYYAEKVVYLPHSYQANDDRRPISSRVPSHAEVGLPETGFVFCSFNNNWKITPRVFDIWIRLLAAVEGSVLWLLQLNPAAPRNLLAEAERRGIAPERLIFAKRVENPEHLARLKLADLCLDTLPYGAHTTASDSLRAGVPIVTCLGNAFHSRVTGSLLNAVGLPELITRSLTEYEALALSVARDEGLLAALNAKLARNIETHPLYKTDLYRRHLEAAFETMWARYQRGEPPASFAVPDGP